jgi:hypothetical protein
MYTNEAPEVCYIAVGVIPNLFFATQETLNLLYQIPRLTNNDRTLKLLDQTDNETVQSQTYGK